MDTIGRINVEARNWLEHIPLEKWVLSHDGGWRYGIMTTNMSKVFNSVLKGARNLPITALVQLTFYQVNNYFIVRREHGVSRLASGEKFTQYIDAKIKAKVVKASSHEVVCMIMWRGVFTLKLDTLLEAVIGNLAHIMLTFKQDMDTQSFPICRDPKNTSMLTLQHRHRSSTIRVDLDMGHVLTCQHKFHREWVLDDRVRSCIIQLGFYVFHQVGHVKVDWPLIIALIERWCPETHSFHMSVDFDLHSIDQCSRRQFDWRLYHERYVALWEAKGDHIVTTEPIEPHMDYHAPYSTIIKTMTSIISREGHELEDSDSDDCRTSIVDIICMVADVMCIIQEDYCIPHVEHGGDLSSMQPPTSSDLPLVQSSASLDPPSIDTYTQLDLPPAILRGKRLRRPRLLPPPPPLFPAPTPSWTDVLHVSHAVPATVRNE
ncbi:Serine/threonine-protein phosphatase 7 long form-like [Vitis vinifera]|uniref:Serine/threonine-protein phosphatase 7 long form-like n=1 Tax=Vitis vinifera TaxID=29760 RepID=A0A438G635_VITVI|nr:Serine/threonine-protein phosphatase 7 long form-like [Vitis vinifera]